MQNHNSLNLCLFGLHRSPPNRIQTWVSDSKHTISYSQSQQCPSTRRIASQWVAQWQISLVCQFTKMHSVNSVSMGKSWNRYCSSYAYLYKCVWGRQLKWFYGTFPVYSETSHRENWIMETTSVCFDCLLWIFGLPKWWTSLSQQLVRNECNDDITVSCT